MVQDVENGRVGKLLEAWAWFGGVADRRQARGLDPAHALQRVGCEPAVGGKFEVVRISSNRAPAPQAKVGSVRI